MRSIWNGALEMGPLVIPVKLLSGMVSDEDRVPVHQVRKSDAGRIRMKRYAEPDGPDGPEVPYSEIVKGYQTPNGQTVLLTKDDFEKAYGGASRQAKILMFADPGPLPRAAHESSYYLQPGDHGERSYQMLAEALTRAGKAAVVEFTLRDRKSLGLLYPDGNGYLVLERLNWAADLHTPEFAAPRPGISETDAALADQMIAMWSGEFRWEDYEDTGAKALADLVAGRIETGQVAGTPETPHSAVPMGLAEMLTASVAAAKAAKGPKAPARKPRARKPAAVKQAA